MLLKVVPKHTDQCNLFINGPSSNGVSDVFKQTEVILLFVTILASRLQFIQDSLGISKPWTAFNEQQKIGRESKIFLFFLQSIFANPDGQQFSIFS